MKHSIIKKFVALIAAVSVVFSMAVSPAMAASATRRCYTIRTGNTTVYSNTGLTAKYGAIYDTDEIYVLDVHDTYSKVKYPAGSSYKTGYIATSAILTSTSSSNTKTASAKVTTYTRPGGASYGYISKGDSVSVLGTSGNYTQVKYPVSDGYKYAFISTSDANSYLKSGSSGGTSSTSSFQWPVTNMYVCGNAWSESYNGKDHLGMDIKSNSGDTNIYCAADGTVAQTGWNSANGYTITIKHTISGKTVYSFYGHLSSINVSQGQTVKKGAKIGVIGNTGSSSTGTHLHFAFTTQCSAGTWGYGTSFSNSANQTSYQGYTYYNPSYIINNQKLP